MMMKTLQTLLSSMISWRVRLTSVLSTVQTATTSPLYTATVSVGRYMSEPVVDNVDMLELSPAYNITKAIIGPILFFC